MSHYVFATIPARRIMDLAAEAREFTKKYGKTGTLVYRIWEDTEVSTTLTHSLTTVKADAAQRAFRALGDGVVWAFSHYGFSANAGLSDDPAKNVGFFRDVITAKIRKGPLVATFSAMDTVVGHVYALASRVAGDNVRALGDAGDPFGGIGRNGAQKTQESISGELHDVGDPYKYQIGVVNNLDGSNHLIVDHSDVTNERVTYAFASSVAMT